MDDKVQKLLQRAINENLSPDRVSYIMQFNGYDQSAIDAALDELSKKKRPVLFQRQYDSSDTPSPSQQVGPPRPSEEEAPVPAPADVNLGEPLTFDQGTGGMASIAEEEEVEVSVSDWWGDKWNGLVEGVSDFMYHFDKETGNTKEQIAEFVELSKEKHPELYNSYQQNLQSEDLLNLGYDQERIKREAASQAYTDFWQTNPEIENEVVPFIRERRRQQDVEETGVKIDEAVTKELDSRFLSGAVKGLAGSIPAMVTSGATMGGSFMTTSYYAADEDLKRTFAENPDLEMTRGQQEAYKLTVAGVEGVLEKIGLSGALKGTSMAKSVLAKKVFSRLAGMGEDVSSEAFERIVKQEAKGLKGYLKNTAQGTLSEAETGALQQLSVDLINETVNGLSGQEVFTPKSAMTIIQDAIYAGAQEAVGGGIISGSVGAFSRDIATQEDFDAAEEFIGRIEISKLEENLDKRVSQDKITEAEKENILNTAKEFKQTMAKVPEDVDQESKRKIYQLINEKMNIQKKAAGKDEAIQNKANERVEGINEQIANIYETQSKKQAEPVAPKDGAVEAAPATEVSPEAEVETRFFAPTIEKDSKGNAVVDPGKVKEETFTGASVISKGHVDEETALNINSALSLLGEKAKDMKVRVFDSVESLLNADQRAADFYVKNNKMPKAYIKGNEMFVLTKNAVEQYNKAKGTNVEYAKQYIHEVGHPIVSTLVAEDPEAQDRLYSEIEAAAAEGDVVAQRALSFGKNYASQGDSKVKNETLVEFMALVTDQKRFKSLNRTTKQKIKDFFNSLLSSISSEVVIKTDAELYDVARSMRDAFRMQKAVNIQPATNKQYQQRSTEFSVDEGTKPGNRLFNEPLPDALSIAENYMQEKGMDYDPGKSFNTLNTEMSQEIAAAYDTMEHNPKDPEVKKAYEAMVKETAEQYDAIIAEGYVVEINNNEPYSSSKDMIEDLASNKRMKIFSTESGFGSEEITDDQRADNPLLRDSGYTDVNGEKLLMNDVFRFVHDFFGHAKRGNGFGPKGEENAWDVHSRMYTPLARRAMTSETRGQNSWVNFSGVNEEAFKLRDKARKLRKEGRTDEASKLIEQVYEMMSFAEQKIGLMPEKYTANPYIEGGDPDFSLDNGTLGKVGEEFAVSDEINTDVESKGQPRLDDVSFSLDEKVKRHEGRGKIVRGKLKDFVGKVMHVTFSDRMLGGFVGKEEYLGGVYFPFITNSVWGANSIGAANKIIKSAIKNADGYRYVVIAMMNPDSHMSNKNMSAKALKELEKELNSSRVSVEEGYSRIMKAFSRKALNEKYGEIADKYQSKRKTKANLIKLIDETLLSDDATFDLRRMFLESVLGKADKNLKLRFGKLPSYGTLAQLLAEPVTRGMNAGDTSFIIRTKGDLSVAEPKKGDPDYHPSYKNIVRSTEDVELVFLDGIYDVVDMFPRIEAKNLGHAEYKETYGDKWRMRYLMYMGLGKMSTTVSDEMVEAEAKAAIDFSTDESTIDFAGIDMKVKEVPASTNAKIPTGGIAYVPVSTLYNLMDMRGGDRGGLYETAEDKKRVQKLVEAFKKEGFEYKGSDALYVDIDADGYGWIGEGNHRVLAARELGMSHLPLRVEFGAARDGKSLYKKDWSRVPTQVVSKDKIELLREQAGPYYHIKYASIWETDLPANKPSLASSTDEEIDFSTDETIDFKGSKMLNEFSRTEQKFKDGKITKVTRTEKSDKPIAIKFPDGVTAVVRSRKGELAEAEKFIEDINKGVYPYADINEAEAKRDILKGIEEGKDFQVELLSKNGSYIGGIKLANDHFDYYSPKIGKMLGEDYKNGLIYTADDRRGGKAVSIERDFRGKGYGSRLYYSALRLLREQVPGARLISNEDTNVTKSAKKFWRSQYNKGLARVVANTSTPQEIERIGGPEVLKQLKDIGAEYTGDIYELIDPTDFSTDEGINWYESPEGKGDPAISRRDVLLEEAAQDLKAGRLKNYEFREMAKGLSPIEKISRFFAPATTERMESALAKNKRISLNKVVKNGTIVALRLDIPAYTGSNTWVVSIHDGLKRDGKVISYRSVARIKDVVFKSNPLAALSIAGGEAKSTIGRMFGKYEGFDGATPEDQAETAKGIVSEIWTSKEWKQIGMNPTRASYFYDRGSGRPVVAAEEVIQIGGLVYAKNPVYARWNDPAFEVKGYSDVDGAPIYFSADEGEGNVNNLRRTVSRTIGRFKDSRERILSNPDAYYTKQSLKAIKENLELMTEDELLENMTAEGLNRVANEAGPGKGENDISVLAAVELINRKAEAGEDVSELLVDLAKVGTTVGRMLRHFAELKSATPLGIVSTIEGALAKANRIMSATQVERLTDIADRFIKAGQVVKDLRDELESGYSKETEAKLIKASKDLDKVTRELNKFTSLIVPKKTMNLLSTTIQGNLLTPISQITNVGANLFQIATSIPVRGFETLFSKITGKFTGGTKRSFKYSLMAIPFALKRGGFGVAEAIETIIKGGASTDKIIHTGFLPGAAFLAALSDTKFATMVNKTLGKEAIKGDVLPQMANGKINPADRLKALYEGVFGIAPEIMFRFLALGDKPFSRFSEGMETYQQAARLGLKGEALKNYIKYPNKKQQKAIEEAGRKLTFQQDSKIATGFFGATNWLEKQGPIGSAVAFALKLTMPYVKTPANIFTETLKFAVPGIGMASAIRNFQKKNFDEGASDLAKAATGQMLVMAANALIANGLVSGAFGEEDEEERSLKYLKFPPMSINKSGLARLMKGENPDYRDGDVFMRYDKFGIVGMVIGARVTSIKNNLVEAKGQAEGYYVGEKDKGFFEPFNRVFDELGVGLGTVQFLNSQSFLTGANGLLSVLSGEASEYDVEKWFENTFRSVTAIPLPNTLSSIHRSIREYMPNLRTNSVENKFRYILMDRLFSTDGVPIKIDMLGNKIPQTPEGANKWIYNLMDFTKTQDSRDQFILNEIYRLYELQEEADLIPGFPTKIQKIPTKHPETGAKITGWDAQKEEEYRRGLQDIQEVYGKNRAEILERLFRSDSYQTLTNERKQERVIETLQDYDRGYKMIKSLPGSGMKNLKPPMEWAKMLNELNDKYFD